MSSDLEYIFGWADPQNILCRGLGGEALIITPFSSGMAGTADSGGAMEGEKQSMVSFKYMAQMESYKGRNTSNCRRRFATRLLLPGDLGLHIIR